MTCDICVVTRTFTATDDCGNEATHTQYLIQRDLTPPTFMAVVYNIEIDCQEVGNLEVYYEPTVSDNCDSDVSLSYQDQRTDGSCPYDYELVRTWTATDDCGNTTTVVQNISVIDTIPPSITSLDDITVSCDQTFLLITPDFSDNCSAESAIFLEYTSDSIPGTCNEYELIRTWVATDECNNSTTFTQSVTVIDTVPPVIGTISGELISTLSRTMSSGKKIMYDQISGITTSWQQVTFPESFPSVPVVLVQVTTANGSEAVVARIRDVTTTGFYLKLQEEEDADQVHIGETVSYVALEQGFQSGATTYEAYSTSNFVNENWGTLKLQIPYGDVVFATTIQTYSDSDPVAIRYKEYPTNVDVEIKAEEELSNDSEETRSIRETIGHTVFDGSGDYVDGDGKLLGEGRKIALTQTDSDFLANRQFEKHLLQFFSNHQWNRISR